MILQNSYADENELVRSSKKRQGNINRKHKLKVNGVIVLSGFSFGHGTFSIFKSSSVNAMRKIRLSSADIS